MILGAISLPLAAVLAIDGKTSVAGSGLREVKGRFSV